jgi:hypothetical protein
MRRNGLFLPYAGKETNNTSGTTGKIQNTTDNAEAAAEF